MEEVEPGWRVYDLAAPQPQPQAQPQIFQPDLPFAYGQGEEKLYFSNFVITISTNVVPRDELERGALADWLRIQGNDLFDDFYRLNGTVLKPAGSPAAENRTFGVNHRIEGVRSRITLEKGDKRGQMHMHVVMEVAHRYTERNEWGLMGVHVNTTALRRYLTDKIKDMEIDVDRRPASIYVHSRLIAALNDQQTKWMALQYIHKGRDKNGASMVALEAQSSREDQNIIAGIRAPDQQFNWRRDDIGLGGALVDNNQPVNNDGDGGAGGGDDGGYGTDDDDDPRRAAPAAAPAPAPAAAPARAPRKAAVRYPLPSESSSWDDRPVRATWTNAGRREWLQKKRR
jgi:hypothetical protein